MSLKFKSEFSMFRDLRLSGPSHMVWGLADRWTLTRPVDNATLHFEARQKIGRKGGEFRVNNEERHANVLLSRYQEY